MSRFAPISLFLTILFLTVPFIGIAQVNQPPVTEARLAEASLKLLQLLHDRRPISDLGKIKDMLQAATSRRKLMFQTAHDNPTLVSQYTWQKPVRDLFPPEVREWIEEKKKLSGKLEVVYAENFDTGFERYYYFLDTPDLGSVQLFSSDNLPESDFSSSAISVDAYSFGNFALLSQSNNEDKDIATLSKGKSRFPLLGQKKLAVILFKFSDQSTAPSFGTPDQIRRSVFHDQNSLSAYYKESSFGRFEVVGEVFGPYLDTNNDLSADSLKCDESFFSKSLAKRFLKTFEKTGQSIIDAVAVGNPSVRDHDYYLFVTPELCSLAHGFAIPEAKMAFVDGQFQLEVATHEFGHLLGLGHAGSINCFFGGENGECDVSAYGDPFSIMGKPLAGQARQLNNFHKARLGWLDRTITKDITKDGIYNITPANEQSSANPISRIRVNAGTYPEAETKPPIFIYLEYRRPAGYFDNFSDKDPVANGVSLRVAGDYDSGFKAFPLVAGTLLTDIYSHNVQEGLNSFVLAGESYYDRKNRIKIEVLSVDRSSAQVRVTFNVDEEKVENLNLRMLEPNPLSGKEILLQGLVPLKVAFTPPSGFHVSEVKLFIDGRLERTSPFRPQSPWVVNLQTWKLSPGPHNISFEAKAGTSKATNSMNVTILPDTTPPIVEITNPPTGATTLPVDTGWVTVSARAKDPTGISSFAICVNDSCTTNFWGCQTTTGSAYVGCSLRVPVSQLTNQSAKVAVLAYDRAYNPNRGAVGIVFPPSVKVEVDQNNSGIVVFDL